MRMGRAFDSFRKRVSSLWRRKELKAIQKELAYIAEKTLADELKEAEEAEPEEDEP